MDTTKKNRSKVFRICERKKSRSIPVKVKSAYCFKRGIFTGSLR